MLKCIGMARVVYIIRKLEIEVEKAKMNQVEEFEDLYCKHDSVEHSKKLWLALSRYGAV